MPIKDHHTVIEVYEQKNYPWNPWTAFPDAGDRMLSEQ